MRALEPPATGTPAVRVTRVPEAAVLPVRERVRGAAGATAGACDAGAATSGGAELHASVAIVRMTTATTDALRIIPSSFRVRVTMLTFYIQVSQSYFAK